MILIVCTDARGGMRFGGRRLSRDRAVTARILERTAGKKLWIAGCSAALFDGAPVTVSEQLLALAGEGEYCFVEDRAVAPWLDRIEGVVRYNWNRAYPADLHLDLPLPGVFRLQQTAQFAGYSHDEITEEVFVR